MSFRAQALVWFRIQRLGALVLWVWGLGFRVPSFEGLQSLRLKVASAKLECRAVPYPLFWGA